MLNSKFTKVNQFLTLVRQLSCLPRRSIGVIGIASLSHGTLCQIKVNIEFMASLHSHLHLQLVKFVFLLFEVIVVVWFVETMNK